MLACAATDCLEACHVPRTRRHRVGSIGTRREQKTALAVDPFEWQCGLLVYSAGIRAESMGYGVRLTRVRRFGFGPADRVAGFQASSPHVRFQNCTSKTS
eukprot:6204858-Pleurochrysis_carterae.AAC.1